ncbi:hypothetical protein [Candidatus Spongiihabitans sp.]|uniref:hypothetical protein n=1 Tax=Candidatus Spongiihabitans sp. TaxID=3101308 RepID=UPI003C6F030A
MKITELQVITYILNCIRIRTKPCKYFQLNSPCFNAKEGIFSKKEMDRLIPEKWRLQHVYDDEEDDDSAYKPENYPIFVKPEWGQNASGVFRADDAASLAKIRKITRQARTRYLIQQGASEKREFEIFSILHHADKNRYAELTITETTNSSEINPVNSIYNPATAYREITDKFSEPQKQALWELLGQIGRFGISRASLRADSIAQMLAGKFHVIEVNLFAPMSINLLDPKYSNSELWQMIRRYMLALARITKYRDQSLTEKPVFTKIMLYNRQNPLLNFIRERL